jgi:hypothetical protein
MGEKMWQSRYGFFIGNHEKHPGHSYSRRFGSQLPSDHEYASVAIVIFVSFFDYFRDYFVTFCQLYWCHTNQVANLVLIR